MSEIIRGGGGGCLINMGECNGFEAKREFASISVTSLSEGKLIMHYYRPIESCLLRICYIIRSNF